MTDFLFEKKSVVGALQWPATQSALFPVWFHILLSTEKDVENVQTLLDVNTTMGFWKSNADVGVHFTPM